MSQQTKKETPNATNTPPSINREDGISLSTDNTTDAKKIANRNAVLTVAKAFNRDDMRVVASVIPSDILIDEIGMRLLANEKTIIDLKEVIENWRR